MARGVDGGRVLRRLRAAYARDPVRARAHALFAVALLLLAVRLAFGEDPWTGGIAERLAEGAPVRSVDRAATYGWWTALALVPAVAALWLAMPLWLRGGADPVRPEQEPARPPRLAAALAAAAVAVGGGLAAPRLEHSLFEDERENVQWAVDGFYVRDGRGTLRFHETGWREALWWYETPNNHVLHTLLARGSVLAWRAAARPPHHLVDETALRLPAWLAGMGSIAALALLLFRLGHPAAGVAAAWLLALHPWHMRYASEARGYSLVLLGLSALLLCLLGVLHRGSWRRWCAFGALQFAVMWTYPAALWYLLPANGAALLAVWRVHRGTPELGQQVGRLAVVDAGAALAWAFFMVPGMLQLRDYLVRPNLERMDASWFRDVGSYFLVGMPWGRALGNPLHWELSDAAAAQPAVVWPAVAAAVALLLAGALRWLGAGGVRALLVPVFVLAPALSVAVALAGGTHLFPQYLVLALPGAAALVAVGLEGAVAPLGPRAGAALIAAAVAAYAVGTGTPRRQLEQRAIEPFRDSVALTRPWLDPTSPRDAGVITVSFHFPPFYYDPRIERLASADELRAWMREADASGRPLYVNVGRTRIAERKHADLAALVEDPALFDKIADLPGLLSRGQRTVWRYRGNALTGAGPRAEPGTRRSRRRAPPAPRR